MRRTCYYGRNRFQHGEYAWKLVPHRNHRRAPFSSAVGYAYTVDGQGYTGSRYSLGEGANAAGRTFTSEAEAAERAAARYRVGQDIPVYYDPADPAEAVLQPGANWGSYVPLILGAFFGLCGGGLFWLLLRLRQAARTAP